MLNLLQYEVYLTVGRLNFACWVFIHAYCHLLIIFQNHHFKKNSFRNTISVSNSLDPDQAQHVVGPDLGSNCLPIIVSLVQIHNFTEMFLIMLSTKIAQMVTLH